MRKFIFLDFDGVLNGYYPNRKLDKISRKKFKDRLRCSNFVYNELKGSDCRIWSIFDLDRKYIQNLNKIIAKTDAKIIFSTSWRGDGYENLAVYLTLKGFLFPENCIDITPFHEKRIRGLEIQQWLDEYKWKCKYAIIDDETCDIEPYHNKENIFKVKGLTKKKADDIIKWLNNHEEAKDEKEI